MIPFQERKKLRKILYSRVTLVILLVVLFAIGNGAWGVHQKASIARTERDIEARALEQLKSRTKELEISLARLNSDIGIEEEVRQKYTVARPGEEIVVVVDEQDKKSKNGGMTEGESLWHKIVSVLGF